VRIQPQDVAGLQARHALKRAVGKGDFLLVVEGHKTIRAQLEDGVELLGALIELVRAFFHPLFQLPPVLRQLCFCGLAVGDVALQHKDEGLFAPVSTAERHLCRVGAAILAPLHGFKKQALSADLCQCSLDVGGGSDRVPAACVHAMQFLHGVAEHGRALRVGLKDGAIGVQDGHAVALVLEQRPPAGGLVGNGLLGCALTLVLGRNPVQQAIEMLTQLGEFILVPGV